jgi:hypothetical protein
MSAIRWALAIILLSAVAAGLLAREPARFLGPAHGPAHAYPPYGSFVSGEVPLYPRVRAKDCDDIAPGAVPVVIAIRDPNICRKPCRCCPPTCVFVQVFVPACPPRKVEVDDHGAKLDLDYGEYEIEIESRKGVITVEYDD